MTTDNFYAEHLERMVQGYAEMAQDPFLRDVVWDRLGDLAEGQVVPMQRTHAHLKEAFADLYRDLPELVSVRAKEIQNARISR